jgi:general stress protein 26
MVSLRPLKDPTLLISKFAAVIPEHWSCTNVAGIVDNDAQLRAITWRKNDVVWWPGGPNDPNACVLVVEPAIAEL